MLGLFRSRIGRRLALVVGLSLGLLGGGGLSVLFERSSRVHDATLRQVLEAMGAAIASSFTHYDPKLGGHAIGEIAAELAPDARSIELEVFDPRGKIRWSTRPAHVGAQVAPELLARIRSSSVAVAPLPASQRVLALPRRASCMPCHEGGPDPLGGLSLSADERRYAGGSVSFEAAARLALAMGVLALTLLVLLLTHRMVVEPLGRLARTMARVEEGDFFARAEVRSRDEIGVLASSFNTLIAKVTDLRVERIDSDREMRGVKAELELKAQLADKSRLLEERVEQLDFLYALGRELARELDPDPVLERLADLVVARLGVPELSVLLFEEGGFARVRVARGFPEGALVELDRPFSLEGSVSAQAAERREPIYVPDLAADPRKIAYRAAPGDRGSLLCVPVIYQDKVFGTLNFAAPRRDAFDPARRELLHATAQQAALALANAQLYRSTLELARVDGLTGLSNRRALEARLAEERLQTERHGEPLSLVMVEVDHFEVFRDAHGQTHGDELLRRVAQLLAGAIRKTDQLGRYAGYTFLAILPRTDVAQAGLVAEKLRRSIEQADFERGFQQPLGRVTVSAGVAALPLHAKTVPELIHAVDGALRRAHAEGRNRVVTLADGAT